MPLLLAILETDITGSLNEQLESVSISSLGKVEVDSNLNISLSDVALSSFLVICPNPTYRKCSS